MEHQAAGDWRLDPRVLTSITPKHTTARGVHDYVTDLLFNEIRPETLVAFGGDPAFLAAYNSRVATNTEEPYPMRITHAIRRLVLVREGLQLFRKLEPHIVVCDIAMPDEDGYVFLREVLARPDALQTTPTLALTAFGRPEERLLALDAGFKCIPEEARRFRPSWRRRSSALPRARKGDDHEIRKRKRDVIESRSSCAYFSSYSHGTITRDVARGAVPPVRTGRERAVHHARRTPILPLYFS